MGVALKAITLSLHTKEARWLTHDTLINWPLHLSREKTNQKTKNVQVLEVLFLFRE